MESDRPRMRGLILGEVGKGSRVESDRELLMNLWNDSKTTLLASRGEK